MPAGDATAPAADRLLFVCTGNLCRSPFAERYAASRVPARAGWSFASAGLAARPGSPMDPATAAQLRRHGGDPEGFVSRVLDPREAADATLVVTMQAAQRSDLLRDQPALAPVTWTLGQLARTVAGTAADLRGAALLAALRERRGRPDPADDVADPYRRGDEAARRTAQRLTEALDVVLPRLG